MVEELTYIGKSPEKIGAREMVTGEARYVVDMRLPGMLYAKILRSPHAHARILKIDTSRAERTPGVKAILTHTEGKIVFSRGRAMNRGDECALDDRVRYVGDKVAAVAAVDEDAAERALELLDVEYEVLPAAFDPLEAMKPDAPQIHPELPNVKGNLFGEFKHVHGDMERGFKEADLVIERRYVTSRICHTPMEPHVNIASWDESGNLTVWGSMQGAFDNRAWLAMDLGLPMNRVRFIVPPAVGGGFGGKSSGWAESIICALLAKKARRPVMLQLTREEEFTSTRTRSPCIFETKSGVKRDGIFTARYLRAFVDLGAYAHGSVMADRAHFYHSTLYRCPNTTYEGYGVYTNTAPSGQMRGFSSTAVHFAIESEIDEVAEELGMDPLELRMKNRIRKGDVIPHSGYEVTSSGLEECVEKGRRSIGWERRQKRAGEAGGVKKRGIGMAMLIHYASRLHPKDPSMAVAMVRFNDDGTAQLLLGTPEIGQGLRTIMAQIAAEELGARLEDVAVTLSDTEITPWGPGVAASKTTYETGGAVKVAAEGARKKLVKLASELLKEPAENLQAKESRVYVKGSPEKGMSFREIIQHPDIRSRGEHIIVSVGIYQVPAFVAPFGAHFAEVEVDTETGQVRVLRLVAAHDVGRAINPNLVEGQIEGAASMGLGYALSEQLTYDRATGQPLNTTFLDYKLLTTVDMPKIEPIIVEPIDPVNVYGVKGVGEHPVLPVAPAVANAVYNATGLRIRELPISAEKVLKELRKQKR